MSGFFSNEPLNPNRLENLRRELIASGTKIIDLTSSNPLNEGFFFPERVLEEASAAYLRKRSYEPSGHGDLRAREAIRDYYLARDPGFRIEVQNIFITASTSESYRLLFSLLAEPGEGILFPDICYPLFEFLARDARVSQLTYALNFDGRWSIRDTSLVNAREEIARAVVLISPHNPTGWTLQEPIPALEELGLPVICDEVFSDYGPDGEVCRPAASFHPDLPVFHLNGISKLFALPDLKLGWIVMNDRALEAYGERLELLNDTYLSANNLTQRMLPKIFAGGASVQSSIRARIQANRELLLRVFPESGRVCSLPAAGGWQALLRLPEEADEEDVAVQALLAGVLVHPGYFYGFPEPQWLVISCLKQEAEFESGIRQLQAIDI